MALESKRLIFWKPQYVVLLYAHISMHLVYCIDMTEIYLQGKDTMHWIHVFLYSVFPFSIHVTSVYT